jgi:ABC-type nitrate/sulfonate/bicarbonate transport system permease component
VFALLVVLAAAGVLLNLVIQRIEVRLCFWSGKASK